MFDQSVRAGRDPSTQVARWFADMLANASPAGPRARHHDQEPSVQANAHTPGQAADLSPVELTDEREARLQAEMAPAVDRLCDEIRRRASRGQAPNVRRRTVRNWETPLPPGSRDGALDGKETAIRRVVTGRMLVRVGTMQRFADTQRPSAPDGSQCRETGASGRPRVRRSEPRPESPGCLTPSALRAADRGRWPGRGRRHTATTTLAVAPARPPCRRGRARRGRAVPLTGCRGRARRRAVRSTGASRSTITGARPRLISSTTSSRGRSEERPDQGEHLLLAGLKSSPARRSISSPQRWEPKPAISGQAALSPRCEPQVLHARRARRTANGPRWTKPRPRHALRCGCRWSTGHRRDTCKRPPSDGRRPGRVQPASSSCRRRWGRGGPPPRRTRPAS